MTDMTGRLHSKFGPASKNYFTTRKAVTTQHKYNNLNENSILEYARSHKFEQATIGLSLLCSLPVDVVERALIDNNGERTLILAKALDFAWETTMSLLFLGAQGYCMSARDIDSKRDEYAHLNRETRRSVLRFYQSRKNAAGVDSDQNCSPQSTI
jgi:hypothetical protein